MMAAVDMVVVRQPLVVAVDSLRKVYHCVSGIVVSRVCDSWVRSKSGRNVCT